MSWYGDFYVVSSNGRDDAVATVAGIMIQCSKTRN